MNDEGRPAGGPRRLPQLVAHRIHAPAASGPHDGLMRLSTSPEWKGELRRLADETPEPYATRLRAIAETNEILATPERVLFTKPLAP